ncbi:MAG: cytochrome c oxidase assembly protein [Pseudomonadota bacterium]
MKKNLNVALFCFALFAAMLGLAYMFPPLYALFCKVTGFDGTTQTANFAPQKVLERRMEVLFTATTHPDLPWRFEPVQKSMTVRVGETALAFYRAKNISKVPVKGMAVYNVSPNKMGGYFNKIHCFCFEEQMLQPGQEVDMPVTFFIDPAIDEEPLMNEVGQVALNYIFQPFED